MESQKSKVKSQRSKVRNHKRRYFIGLLVGLTALIGLRSDGAFAQEKLQEEKRVGVDQTKKVNMTMREAMLLALENNRDIEVERLNVQMAQFDVLSAQGAYDPALAATLYYDRRLVPATSIFANGQTTNAIGLATVDQLLPWNGSNLRVIFDNNRATTANPFNVLNPQYNTNLSFTFTQPLWRNRETDQFRNQIKITKKRLDISDSQFRQRAIEIIAQLQRAYWDLIFNRRDYEIKRESVELARTQLEHNQRLVEAGSLAPADIISARVEVERRRDEAEAAVDAIQRAENSLKTLLLQPGNSEMWDSEIIPVEKPQVEPAPALPLPDAVKLAFQNRPEMEQYRLLGELNQFDVDYYRNQAKPQIDLFATYGSVGLSGFERTEVNPITASNQVVIARVNQLSTLAGLQPLPSVDFGGIPDFVLGGYGTSMKNLLRNDFRSWRFGVTINLPIRNRTAEGNLGRALAEGKQIDVQRQRTEQLIEVEVRNALQAVETSGKRVEAARNSRINAELQYQSEQRKFDAGQSTNFFVLDRQNALSAARGRELRAMTDYTKAVAELQRVMSTTLSSNNMEVTVKGK
ncbi:MAG: TolC family protein [Acidobacteria bacterium]|nr:TolC family protein [Acidobacteriota bacterium]